MEKKQLSAPISLNSEKIVLVPVNDGCLQWGNFYEEQIQYSETAMAEFYPDLSYEWESIGNAMKYLLFIPSLPNKEATNRMINKLRNFGIVSFRIKKTEERWKNTISVGVYDDKQEAQKQLEDLVKKGIANAMIEEFEVELKKMIIHQSNAIIQKQMEKVVEQFEGTQLTAIQCKD
ncbi:SPOR domain-containing protein [Nitrosomonas sp. PY1]|uniref:SPOR domain-containing protein n=1 Tax=Nitrosomonas sp. PY1 TaxID=1803906 RepID=UPI001FC8276D|nr:SPOR domain-containing protein [Nitrosomonas sp. PY1]